MAKLELCAFILLSSACASDAPGAVDARPPTPATTLEVTYIAHASFLLEASDGTQLLLDPYASRLWLGYDYPQHHLSATNVAITHPHYDHDFGEFIGREVPWTQDQTVLREVGSYELGPFHVRGVRGKHADPWGMEFDQKNTIWLVELGDLRLAHLGDNGPLSEQAATALGRVDILMAPIDDNEHILSYAQLETIVDRLQPAWLIPMHYRLPDLETNPLSPDDLGTIDLWLSGQEQVERVGASERILSSAELPASTTTLVFEHSITQ